MTDIELLELAAKAAGFQNWTVRSDSLFIETGSSRGDNGYYWNPLTDNGDALRLAVKLNLEIVRSRITDAKLHVVSCHKQYEDVHEEYRWQWEFCKDDPYAATRRAITRAAAAIGGAA